MAAGRPPALPARDRVRLRPHVTALPEPVAPSTKLRDHQVVVDADCAPGAGGVLVTQGGQFGGWSLHVVDDRLEYTYNFAGVDEIHVRSEPLGPGRHVLGVEVLRSPDDGPTAMRATLVVDGMAGPSTLLPRTTPLRFGLHGEGLACGYSDGTSASGSYRVPYVYPCRIHDAFVDVSGTAPFDLHAEIERAWMIQ